MKLIAVDPGVHECACAEFVDGSLTRVEFISAVWGGPGSGRFWPMATYDVDECVIEIPQHDKRVGVHNSALALHAGLIAGACRCGVYAYTPSNGENPWKGSTPKPVHHRRVWAELSPDERAVFPAGTEARIIKACEKGALDGWRKPGGEYYGKAKGADGIGARVHNVLDAVALGMHHLGRYSEVKR